MHKNLGDTNVGIYGAKAQILFIICSPTLKGGAIEGQEKRGFSPIQKISLLVKRPIQKILFLIDLNFREC